MDECDHEFSGGTHEYYYYYFDTAGNPDHGPPYPVIVQRCDYCGRESQRPMNDKDMADLWDRLRPSSPKKRILQFLKPSVIARAKKYAEDYGGTQKHAIDLALMTVTARQLKAMPSSARVPASDGKTIQARITKDSRDRLAKLHRETGQNRNDIVYHALEVLRDKWEIEAE